MKKDWLVQCYTHYWSALNKILYYYTLYSNTIPVKNTGIVGKKKILSILPMMIHFLASCQLSAILDFRLSFSFNLSLIFPVSHYLLGSLLSIPAGLTNFKMLWKDFPQGLLLKRWSTTHIIFVLFYISSKGNKQISASFYNADDWPMKELYKSWHTSHYIMTAPICSSHFYSSTALSVFH